MLALAKMSNNCKKKKIQFIKRIKRKYNDNVKTNKNTQHADLGF